MNYSTLEPHAYSVPLRNYQSGQEWEGQHSNRFAKTIRFRPAQDLIKTNFEMPDQTPASGRSHFKQTLSSPEQPYKPISHHVPPIDHWHPRASSIRTIDFQPAPKLRRAEMRHHNEITHNPEAVSPYGLRTFYRDNRKSEREYSVEDRMQRKTRADQLQIRKSYYKQLNVFRPKVRGIYGGSEAEEVLEVGELLVLLQEAHQSVEVGLAVGHESAQLAGARQLVGALQVEVLQVLDLLEHVVEVDLELFGEAVDVDLGAAKAEVGEVAEGAGDDLLPGQVQEGLVLHVDGLDVLFLAHLGLGVHFLLRAGAHLHEHLQALLQLVVDVGEALVDVEASLGGLLGPGLAVPVSLEPDVLGLGGQLLDHLVDRLPVLDLLSGDLALLGQSGSDDAHGVGGVLGRAQSSELELVAGVGVGAGSVPVGVLLEDVVGDGRHRLLEVLLDRALLAIENGRDCLSDVGRDDLGRSLVPAQSHLVAGVGDGGEVEGVVALETHEGQQYEQSEHLDVELVLGIGHCEEVLELAVRVDVVDRVVCVLTRAVDLAEGLLVQKDRVAVAGEDFLEQLHHEQVAVDGVACLLVDAGELELVVSHLVVLCLERNANLEHFFFNLPHHCFHLEGDLGVVVVRELLILGAHLADHGPAAVAQIVPLVVGGGRNDEELLLKTQEQSNFLDLGATGLQEVLHLSLHDGLRPTEDGLVVESLTVVGDQQGGDVEHLGPLSDEDFGLRVPEVVCSGPVGLAHVAVGHAAAVSLALEQDAGVEEESGVGNHLLAEVVSEIQEGVLLLVDHRVVGEGDEGGVVDSLVEGPLEQFLAEVVHIEVGVRWGDRGLEDVAPVELTDRRLLEVVELVEVLVVGDLGLGLLQPCA